MDSLPSLSAALLSGAPTRVFIYDSHWGVQSLSLSLSLCQVQSEQDPEDPPGLELLEPR